MIPQMCQSLIEFLLHNQVDQVSLRGMCLLFKLVCCYVFGGGQGTQRRWVVMGGGVQEHNMSVGN